MTKKQAKMFARIHSAVHISNIDGFAFMDHSGNVLVNEKDQDKMLSACYDLSDKILGDLPEFHTSVDIYNYVINNF